LAIVFLYGGSSKLFGEHSIGRKRYAWHDGPIRDAKAFDSMDLELGIDDREMESRPILAVHV
jgi:hypothetical protein